MKRTLLLTIVLILAAVRAAALAVPVSDSDAGNVPVEVAPTATAIPVPPCAITGIDPWGRWTCAPINNATAIPPELAAAPQPCTEAGWWLDRPVCAGPVDAYPVLAYP